MAQVPFTLYVDDTNLIAGPQGPAGAAGTNGTNGVDGADGAQGATGPAGSSSGMVYTSVTGDNTTAFNAFLAAAVTAGEKTVSLKAETISFDSKPTIPAGIRIIGHSSSETVLVRNYSGDFIEFGAGFNGGMARLALFAAAGTTGGVGLLLKATASTSCDYASFEDLVITGAGSYDYPLKVDGSLRTSPQGIRDLEFRNINLFAGTIAALYIINGVGINFFGLGAYPAGGTSGNVYIGGGSNTVNLYGANVQGELNLTSLQKLVFSGHIISLNSAGTASKCHISGTVSGSAVNNLANSSVNLV